MKWLNGYRMRLVLVGFVAAIVFGGGNAKADFTWTQKADMPTTRYAHSTSVVGGKIYAIGGWGSNLSTLVRVDEYDPTTDTWTKKADMPTARGCTSTCVVNGKIYVIDGEKGDQPISIVEVYDPATDTWAEQTELPTQRYWLSTSVVDGIIYVIGGNTGPGGGWTHLNTVEAYDPSTDTWTRKADMPTGRSFSSTCMVDGKIYVIGGAMPGKSAVEAYDPETDTWTRKAPMPTARYLLGTSEVGGKIYAIGGWQHSAEGPLYSAVEAYDPETDTWTKVVDIPVPRSGLSTSVVDGNIYVIGGALTIHNGTFVHTSAMYAYDIIVDFNGDGIVDADDMCIMIDHWGEDYSLYDIGPMPWGDGVVDIQDLIVLAEHLFEEVFPIEFVAYWKLDEEEGDIAYNSIDDNHGILSGNPTWQPDSGQVAGALELDGTNDYISTDFVLNPSDGPYSVFAWIKGGAPGQVIISQSDGIGTGATWLGMDALGGNLMTGLRPPGTRSPTPPMVSDFVITDGQWHHVGIVVTSHGVRNLYADGMRVAADTQGVNLPSSNGGLYFGTSKTLDADTFFSGLIDDVRIYNKALSPAQIAALAQ